MSFLGKPEWQGVGALLAAVAIVVSIIFELRKRRRKGNGEPGSASPKIARSKLYDLSTDGGEAEFYKALAQSIRTAQQVIYRSGRGFSDGAKSSFVQELILAEDLALASGVKIIRIQTSDRTSKDWAERYAALVERYPDLLNVYADFKDPLLVNIGLVDPDGKNPQVQILFETATSAGRGSYAADAAMSFDGQARFALSLKQQFEEWADRLRPLDADEVRQLAQRYLYFAYGSNMSFGQMRQRCPGAARAGKGIIYGWKRNFAVAAPHMGASAAAAGIERSDNESDRVEGVVYDLTLEDKRNIDEVESGGYEPVEVGFKLKGQHVSGFIHVPIRLDYSPHLRPTDAYIQTMIEGAKSNGLDSVAKYLRDEFNVRDRTALSE